MIPLVTALEQPIFDQLMACDPVVQENRPIQMSGSQSLEPSSGRPGRNAPSHAANSGGGSTRRTRSASRGRRSQVLLGLGRYAEARDLYEQALVFCQRHRPGQFLRFADIKSDTQVNQESLVQGNLVGISDGILDHFIRDQLQQLLALELGTRFPVQVWNRC